MNDNDDSKQKTEWHKNQNLRILEAEDHLSWGPGSKEGNCKTENPVV